MYWDPYSSSYTEQSGGWVTLDPYNPSAGQTWVSFQEVNPAEVWPQLQSSSVPAPTPVAEPLPVSAAPAPVTYTAPQIVSPTPELQSAVPMIAAQEPVPSVFDSPPAYTAPIETSQGFLIQVSGAAPAPAPIVSETGISALDRRVLLVAAVIVVVLLLR